MQGIRAIPGGVDALQGRLITHHGIVKWTLTAVSDAQHGGFTTGSSPVSWGSIAELFVNLTVSIIPRCLPRALTPLYVKTLLQAAWMIS